MLAIISTVSEIGMVIVMSIIAYLAIMDLKMIMKAHYSTKIIPKLHPAEMIYWGIFGLILLVLNWFASGN